MKKGIALNWRVLGVWYSLKLRKLKELLNQKITKTFPILIQGLVWQDNSLLLRQIFYRYLLLKRLTRWTCYKVTKLSIWNRRRKLLKMQVLIVRWMMKWTRQATRWISLGWVNESKEWTESFTDKHPTKHHPAPSDTCQDEWQRLSYISPTFYNTEILDLGVRKK